MLGIAVPLVLSLAVAGRAAAQGADCDGNGRVDLEDVREGLRVAVGIRPLNHCTALDVDANGQLSTDERLTAAPNESMRRYWHTALEWNEQPSKRVADRFATRIRNWLVADGFPGSGDVLMRNAVITARYAQWYRQRPDELKWAGCAAFVSYKVGLGLMPHKLETAFDRAVDPQRLEQDPVRLASLDLLRTTNTAVYHDLGWAHAAYLTAGLAAVEEGLQGVPDHGLMLQGFRAIDAGKKLLRRSPQEAQNLIWNGNTLLLRHEQAGIIQDQLSQMDSLSARVLSWLIAVDFSGKIVSEDDSLARFTRSMQRHGRHNASVTNFDDRWLWIEDEIFPTWRRLDQRKRQTLMERAEELMYLPWSLWRVGEDE